MWQPETELLLYVGDGMRVEVIDITMQLAGESPCAPHTPTLKDSFSGPFAFSSIPVLEPCLVEEAKPQLSYHQPQMHPCFNNKQVPPTSTSEPGSRHSSRKHHRHAEHQHSSNSSACSSAGGSCVDVVTGRSHSFSSGVDNSSSSSSLAYPCCPDRSK